MKIVLGRFIKKKDEFDSENIVCPIKGYDRDKYLNRRIFFRILFILIYGFGLGYIIGLTSVTIHDVKVIIFNFILFYICNFYLIQIPHEFIHMLFYPNPFKNNKMIFFNKKRIVTTELSEFIKPLLLVLSLITPFILFSILPLIAIYFIGFNIYLYTLSFANAILSSDDLLNIILQLFVKKNQYGKKRLYIIPNDYNYLNNDDLKNNNIKVNNEIIEDSTTLPLSNQILQDKLNDINIEDNTVEDSEYKNNDDITKVEALESGYIRENIDVEDNINQSSNKFEKECKIILKDKDESIYSLEDFNNEFINKMSDDLIKEIDEINEDSTSNKNETVITKDDFTSIKSSELIELLDKMISDD